MKIHIAIGETAKGELRQLYLGRDAGEAKRIRDEAVAGQVKDIVKAGEAIGLRLDRVRDVEPNANHGVLNLKGTKPAAKPAPEPVAQAKAAKK